MCSSSKPRILYIDDDTDACELIVLMLQTADGGYDVTAFTDPEKAIAFMENQPIALFILDYALPRMTGVELCRRIRRGNLQAPILFYSGMARESDREEAQAAGATEYLVKPNDLEKLTETVSRLLRQRDASDIKGEPLIKIKEYKGTF